MVNIVLEIFIISDEKQGPIFAEKPFSFIFRKFEISAGDEKFDTQV